MPKVSVTDRMLLSCGLCCLWSPIRLNYGTLSFFCNGSGKSVIKDDPISYDIFRAGLEFFLCFSLILGMVGS